MRPLPLEDFGIRWLSGPRSKGDLKMRYLKYLALLALLAVPLAYSQAQVAVGVGVNVGPRYADYDSAGGPPVCPYGYYSYYPYACAPYGYYGPRWFVGGVFIGAGPWYHWQHVGYWGHPGYWNRGYYGRGYGHGYVRGNYGRAYAGNYGHGGSVHGYAGGGYRGGGNFHGGGHR